MSTPESPSETPSPRESKAVNAPTHRGVHRQRIPFHDCDPLAIAWHGHYLKYLEIARTELFEHYGLTETFFKNEALYLVVIESRLRHAFPCRFGDEIEVTARFVDVEQRLHLAYEVRNLTHGRRAVRAWTTLVAMKNGEMTMETPDAILRQLRD
ncbi:MAG: acyl-CoA thioesterase [Sandaracinus sp.]|nr:acyl-CoA thioesterase [Sandaracinus sp.]MCB9632956.1 acyl-CoA thioesterase [Sandaracinus sp.]